MKGSKKVIDSLNYLLAGELSAADQYFIHSRMYENWGLSVLFKRIDHERAEELEHAAKLIQRILFLDGVPDVATRRTLTVGDSVPKMLAADLEYELTVIRDLRQAIALAESESDFETRRILIDLLEETEQDHTLWLEQQLGLIDKMGLGLYLQSATGCAPAQS